MLMLTALIQVGVLSALVDLDIQGMDSVNVMVHYYYYDIMSPLLDGFHMHLYFSFSHSATNYSRWK